MVPAPPHMYVPCAPCAGPVCTDLLYFRTAAPRITSSILLFMTPRGHSAASRRGSAHRFGMLALWAALLGSGTGSEGAQEICNGVPDPLTPCQLPILALYDTPCASVPILTLICPVLCSTCVPTTSATVTTVSQTSSTSSRTTTSVTDTVGRCNGVADDPRICTASSRPFCAFTAGLASGGPGGDVSGAVRNMCCDQRNIEYYWYWHLHNHQHNIGNHCKPD